MKNNYVMLNELSKQFTMSSFYILTECRRANGGGSAKFFQQLYIDTYYLFRCWMIIFGQSEVKLGELKALM